MLRLRHTGNWGLRKYGDWRLQSVYGVADAFMPPRHQIKRRHHLDLLKMRAERNGYVELKCPHVLICALGLEPTLDQYVDHLLEGFRELHRVLRDDGVLWLNLGDCYITKPIGSGSRTDPKYGGVRTRAAGLRANRTNTPEAMGFKHKDLAAMAWRVAIALQNDGWHLRSDIVWNKPNPMPEAVTDRPTRAHEFIFLLTKEPQYFYDHEAIKEESSDQTHPRGPGNVQHAKGAQEWFKGDPRHRSKVGLLAYAQNQKSSTLLVPTEPGLFGVESPVPGVNPKANGPNSRMVRDRSPRSRKPNASRADIRPKQNASFSAAVTQIVPNRNKRDVWTVATEAYHGAHFATFPTDLIKPCILAGTSARGVCPKCGAPWLRVTEKPKVTKRRYAGKYAGEDNRGPNLQGALIAARQAGGTHDNPFPIAVTVGWQPGCKCKGNNPVPATVIDPFGGAGTTGKVALELGRSAILIEMNPDYLPLIRERTSVTPGLPIA